MKDKLLILTKKHKIMLCALAVIVLCVVGVTSVYAYQSYQVQQLAKEKAREEKLALEAANRNLKVLKEVESSVLGLFMEDGQGLAEGVNQEMINVEYAKMNEFNKDELNNEGIALFNELKLAVSDANNILLLNKQLNDYTIETVLNDDSLAEKIEFVMSAISDNRTGYIETVQSNIADVDTEVAVVKDVQEQVVGLLNEDGTAVEGTTRESYDAVKALVGTLTIESIKADLDSKLSTVLASIEIRELAEVEAAMVASASNNSSSSNHSSAGSSNSGGGNSSGNYAASGGSSSGGSSSGGSSTSGASNNSSASNSGSSSASAGGNNSSSSNSGSSSASAGGNNSSSSNSGSSSASAGSNNSSTSNAGNSSSASSGSSSSGGNVTQVEDDFKINTGGDSYIGGGGGEGSLFD